MRLQIGDDEGAGKVGVIPGNADCAEQVAVMVVAGHELADALPNETESQRPLLVFRNNEGAPHFQRAVQHPQSGRGKGKVFPVVQPFHTVAGKDFVRFPHAVGAHNFLVRSVPQEQVLVMVVVCIQVAGVAGTFPHLAESIFPQTPYFNKDIGDLQGIRHVHVPISIFLTGMQTLRGQRVDFRLHILHGNGGGQRGHLRLPVLFVHMGAAAFFITFAQQIGAQAQMGDDGFIGIILSKLAERNGLAYHNAVCPAAVPTHFTGKERHARLAVDQGNALEQQAVAPREIYGHYRRFRHADNGGDIRVPGVVRHPFVGQGKAGDRAGGENAQNPALT